MSDLNLSVDRSLKVASFNCQGCMRSANYISHLLDKYDLDFMCLYEHWLFPDSLSFLNSLSGNYHSHAVPDSSLDVLDPYRRGKGGVAIMWKKLLNDSISILPIDSDKIIRVTLQLKSVLTILAVYYRRHVILLINMLSV
jgi:hypothetical protein